MYKLVLMFASLFLLVGSPANAEGQAQDKWLVTQLSGDARVVHAGFQPVALKVNGEISSGDTLITGLTGRATLVRGADYIVIAPHSELRLPSTPQPSGFTRVIQNVGTMLFKVRHTGIPHFAVDTPMLAAVVKGTTFTVVVDQQRSAVQVIQGAVQVTAVEGGMSRLVEGGRTVFVDHARPRTLFNADKPTPATPATSAPSSVSVSAAGDSPLTSIGELTGGLVRAEIGSTKTASLADPIIATTATLQKPAAGTAPSQPTEAAPAAQSAPATNATTVTVQPTAPAPAAAAVTTAPAVTTPTVAPPAVTTPTVTVPSVTTPAVTTPTVTVPSVTTPAVIVLSVTTPTVTIPTVTVPSVTTPTVTIPTVTVPSVTTPAVTVPSVTTPAVTVPSVTTPTVTTPTVTVPSVTTPTVTVPTITTPTVTVPSVTVPSVTTPIVTVPTVTIPTVTVPAVTIPSPLSLLPRF